MADNGKRASDFPKVERLLVRWGDWCSASGRVLPAGFGNATTIGRFRRNGGVVARSNGYRRADREPELEAVEELITRLRERQALAADALILAYAADQGLGAIARELGTSVNRVNVFQRIGKAWLDGALAEVQAAADRDKGQPGGNHD